MFPDSNKKDQKIAGKKADHKVKDYGNEPFFLQKAEASKKVIEKYGLPGNQKKINK